MKDNNKRCSMPALFRYAATLGAACALLGAGAAHAQNVIKIGEINSYKSQPAFLEPYRNGMLLAVEEVNAAGGIGGKKLELITRDDNANPGEAVRAAEELLSRERVDVLMGSYLSHIGLALTDFARQKKVFFLASEPLTDKIVWQNGNRYTFRLRVSTYMQAAMLVPEAVKMQKSAGRWSTPTTSTANRQWRRSRPCSNRPSRTWSSSTNRRCRLARSTPAAWCRRWPTPNRTPSSMCCSAPTSPSWCAKAIPAACSRVRRW